MLLSTRKTGIVDPNCKRVIKRDNGENAGTRWAIPIPLYWMNVLLFKNANFMQQIAPEDILTELRNS